jgi:hypothetical protein
MPQKMTAPVGLLATAVGTAFNLMSRKPSNAMKKFSKVSFFSKTKGASISDVRNHLSHLLMGYGSKSVLRLQ